MSPNEQDQPNRLQRKGRKDAKAAKNNMTLSQFNIFSLLFFARFATLVFFASKEVKYA